MLLRSHRVTVTFIANSCNRLCCRTAEAAVSSSSQGLLSPYLVLNTEEFLLAHMMLLLRCCQESNWEPLAFLKPLKPTVTALLSLLAVQEQPWAVSQLTRYRARIHSEIFHTTGDYLIIIAGFPHIQATAFSEEASSLFRSEMHLSKVTRLQFEGRLKVIFFNQFYSPKTVLHFSFDLSCTSDHSWLVLSPSTKSQPDTSCFIFSWSTLQSVPSLSDKSNRRFLFSILEIILSLLSVTFPVFQMPYLKQHHQSWTQCSFFYITDS